MKKTVSVCLAVILALTLAFSAFAVGKVSKESVLNEVNAAIGYVSDGISAYTVDSAVNYYYIAKEGTNGEGFYPAFLQSVKDCLDANCGKLVTAYGENITSYAAVIGIIDAMGGNPTDVNSVNLVELFENFGDLEVSTPYHYDIVIPVAGKYCNEERVKALCDSFIEDYYTMGSGMDYWGFSCDNTAMLLSAIAQSGLDCYDIFIEDAVKILDTYKTEGGYCFNPEYGTTANANSTGLVLMAKCAYYSYKGTVKENFSELCDIYNALLTFKGKAEGSFIYVIKEGEEDNAYTAADALKGLASFYAAFPVKTPDDYETVVTPENPDVKPDKPSIDGNGSADKNHDIPNTSVEFSVFPAAVTALTALAVTFSLKKKKENAD